MPKVLFGMIEKRRLYIWLQGTIALTIETANIGTNKI